NLTGENLNELDEDVSIIAKTDYISAVDDLAFDIYQDPQVATIIRKLEEKKLKHVNYEDYEEAKNIKNTIAKLQKIGEELAKFEIEKLQAIEIENYDVAKEKKTQMENYRQIIFKDLGVEEILNDIDNQNTINDKKEDEPIKEYPIPEKVITPTPQNEQQQLSAYNQYNEKPLPANAYSNLSNKEKKKQPLNPQIPNEDGTDVNSNYSLKSLKEHDERESSNVTDVLGIESSQKIFNKKWTLRSESLNDMINYLEDESSKDDSKLTLKACVYMLTKLLNDNVFAVFIKATDLYRKLVSKASVLKFTKSDINFIIDKTFPVLFPRCGDMSLRLRDSTKSFIMEVSNMPDIKSTPFAIKECLKPLKPNTPSRIGICRTEIVELLYDNHNINQYLTLPILMKFCVVGLRNNFSQVRELCTNLILKLYKNDKNTKNYLHSDDENTRKNLIYRFIFDSFDRIDGKPTRSELEKEKLMKEENHKEKMRAEQEKQLQQQLEENRKLRENFMSNKNRNSEPKKSQEIEDDDKLQSTCIFCGKYNADFGKEDGSKLLDMHYWKSCPMLHKCPNCSQVIEIRSYSQHLLNDCKKKDEFIACSKCTESISEKQFTTHQKQKYCSDLPKNHDHCPLCHENFPEDGEAGWREHLMSKSEKVRCKYKKS
ncbi:Centrosomal protein, partial [Intoshia linei]